MPNWCNNTLRVTHRDLAVIEYVEAWLDYAIELGELEEDARKELPVPTLQRNSLSEHEPNSNQDLDEDESLLNLESFAQVWEIFGHERVHNTNECSFTSRWGPPPDLYDALEAMGCDVSDTYMSLDAESCGVYENKSWTDYGLDDPHLIPDVIKQDYELNG